MDICDFTTMIQFFVVVVVVVVPYVLIGIQ